MSVTSDTWDHIDRALLAFLSEPEETRIAHAAYKLSRERNERDASGKPKNCGNKPLAYAEHYLIARSYVAHGNLLERGARAAWMSHKVGLYDVGKLVYFISTLPVINLTAPCLYIYVCIKDIYKAGICPPTAPDIESTKWGLRGCHDGKWKLSPGVVTVH